MNDNQTSLLSRGRRLWFSWFDLKRDTIEFLLCGELDFGELYKSLRNLGDDGKAVGELLVLLNLTDYDGQLSALDKIDHIVLDRLVSVFCERQIREIATCWRRVW